MYCIFININNNIVFINLSPWPFILILSSFNLRAHILWSTVFNFNYWYIFNLIIPLIVLIMWSYNSNLNKVIFGFKRFFYNLSLKRSIIMFIGSEIMFFITFFYVYYSNYIFNFYFCKKFYLVMFKLNFIISLMNLIILVTSSLTFMVFIKRNKSNNNYQEYIWITVFLRVYFVRIQLFEYYYLAFNLCNSVFYSIFYLLTIFHIRHVIIGTVIMTNLIVNKMYLLNNLFIKIIYICWYWHFIDFIWILIFFIVYYFNNINKYI